MVDYISYHKLVIFGEKGVGKTSLVNRMANHEFQQDLPSSYFIVKSQICVHEDNLPPFHLSVYEMQIDDNILFINKKVIFNSSCIVFMFDLTKEETYDKLKLLIKAIVNIDKHSKIPKLLIGNKLDEEENRVVAGYEAKSLIDDDPSFLQYIDISMQTSEGYDELIHMIYKSFQRKPNEEYPNERIEEFREWSSNSIPPYNPSAFVYKIIIIGDSEVGKTAFLNRSIKKEYSPATKKTVGIKDDCKYIQIGCLDIKIHIWDTAGLEKFNSLPKKYFQQADGVILMFDLTREESLKNTEEWLKDIHEYSKSDVVVYLVGNKCDMINERKISQDKGNSYAFLQGIKYTEISCKYDMNVKETLYAVVWDIYANSEHNNHNACSYDSIGLIKMDDEEKKGGCCFGREK